MIKELEELRDKYGFELQCSEIDGCAVYALKERKPLFINTIGEKFYDKDATIYWFSKLNLNKRKCSLCEVIDEAYTDNDSESQIYKTEASRDKALEEYKESLKPKHRAFKLEEANEYLGLKVMKKDKSAYRIMEAAYSQNILNEYFERWVKLEDGSPAGKLI